MHICTSENSLRQIIIKLNSSDIVFIHIIARDQVNNNVPLNVAQIADKLVDPVKSCFKQIR